MKKLIFIVALLISAATGAWAQNEEYNNEFKRMMELSGNTASFEQVIPQIVSTMRQQIPNVPAEYWGEMGSDVSSLLVDMLAPIYYKYLAIEDLKQINEFYNTPAGKKWGISQPEISKEQLAVSMQWGQEIGQKIIERLRMKGYFK